jgi:hypothetical protein
MNKLTIVKQTPELDWYLEQIIKNYPEVTVEEIINTYNQIKENE